MPHGNTPLAAGLLLGGVLLLVGITFAITGRAMAKRSLKPNGFVGIRIPGTMRSPEQWYAGHQAAAPVILAAAVAFILLGLTGLICGIFKASEWILVVVGWSSGLAMVLMAIGACAQAVRGSRTTIDVT